MIGETLSVMARVLEPKIRAGGYGMVVINGCMVMITCKTKWRAEMQYAKDVSQVWDGRTLLSVLECGVHRKACPFHQTAVSDWSFGSTTTEKRYQENKKKQIKYKAKHRTIPSTDIAAPYEPALCHHCTNPILLEASLKGAMFCCDRCQEVAAIIRSARISIENGKYDEESDDGGPSMTKMVTDLKIVFVSFGDGYPKKARYLTKEQKQAIMYRDNGTCQMCGKPATDIDHISGSSPDPSNLRALCKYCNVTRAIKKLRPLTPEQEARKAAIWKAILADEPQRLCHDETLWKHIWSDVKRIHKQVPTQAEREILFEKLARTYSEY